jgi:prepilin-type N-terminal cleavage/methylation domain-containing protein
MKQKGYTLIELLLVICIIGVISLAVNSSVVQIIRGFPAASAKSVAMVDIDSAAHWLCTDLVLAQTTSLTDGAPPTSSVTLNWSDLTQWAQNSGNVTHSASYVLSGTQLLRDYDGTQTIIGRYLTNFGVSINGTMFTVTLTSFWGGTTGSRVTRTFSIQERSKAVD